VARRTPELARRHEPFVHFYDDASDLPAVCRTVLTSPTGREAVAAHAAAQSWTRKAGGLLDFVRAVLDQKRMQGADTALAGRPIERPSMRFWPQKR
jgi:hypothetical protein